MHDKDLSDQLDGLFSDAAPEREPEEEKKESQLEGMVDGLLEVEPEPAEEEPSIAPTPPQIEQREPEPASVSRPGWRAKIEEQRARILNILLVSASAIGALLIGGMASSMIREPSQSWLYVPYFISYAVLLTVTLSQGLSFRLRAATLIGLTYTVGVISLFRGGPLSPGALYLLAAPVMSSILISRRAGAIASGVSGLLYIAFALAGHLGWLALAYPYEPTQLRFALEMMGTFVLTMGGAGFSQWMFNRTLTDTAREAEAGRAEAQQAQVKLEEQTHQLRKERAQLEEQIQQLQTAAQVCRVAVSMLEPNELTQQVVDLVRERFNLRYVGLFLIDEERRWAVLKSGTGEVGSQMVEDGYRVEIGENLAVGWCTATGQARLAHERHWGIPSLSDVQSELALPLRSQGRVTGALDLHSTEPNAFSDEDVAVLQSLADQVAIAIDNAYSFTQIRARLEEIEEARSRPSFVGGEGKSIYERTRDRVPPHSDDIAPEVERAIAERRIVEQLNTGDGANKASLIVPIVLRDQVIGVLGLEEIETGRGWTEDEKALIEDVADQMALAIENARLLEQTQRHAQRDRLIADITSRVRSSMHLETILQTAVRELGEALGTDRAVVQLSTDIASPSSEENRAES